MNERLSKQRSTRMSPVALLADETEERTRWLAALLEEAGYGVVRERSGQGASERARAVQPDVIIIADLPDVVGTELCRTLRGDGLLQHNPPIFLALAQPATPEQRLAALRAGASECVALPLDSEEIVLRADAYVHARRDAERVRADGLLDPNTGLYNRQGLARRARELGSLAFREHGPFACVVLAFDLGPDDTADLVTLGVHALQSAARRSDVIGRLGPTEFAVLAPGTNASGARHMAERLTRSVETAAHSRSTGGTSGVQVRCGVEAVANVGYTPIEPVELLVRAAAALRRTA
jgi:diguanylate cyclase (GGDEF)-like protein